MNLRLIASTIVLTAAVVACGGGGGSSPTPATNSPTSTATPTQSPATTNASGTVVADDANGSAAAGSPLAGVSVKVMPWAPCGPTPAPETSITPENDGCPTPLPSPQTTTASNGTFTLNGVPNGHYILVIGADTVSTPPAGYVPPSCTVNCGTPTPAPFTVQATVHDNVTLTGGNQTLAAPTMPPVPSGYTPPTWETNGDYRLATLDAAKEMPCYIAWQYLRAKNNLAGGAADEWITENNRAVIAYETSQPPGTYTSPIVAQSQGGTGGTDCYNSVLAPAFSGQNPYMLNARALWFSGIWYLYELPTTTFYQGGSLTQSEIDPRSSGAPANAPTWP